MSRSRRRAAGFTLVELLVVILIIGILIALLVPAVYYVVKKGRMSAIAFEVSQLEQAVQAYKSKYGDYPPDFSDVLANTPANWQKTITYKHIRKVFQRATPTELTIVGTYIKGNQLTPAEALVFWLGGLSSSATQPFTGTGGPLLNVGTAMNPIWVLRVQERNAPIFTFAEDRLVLRNNNNNQVIGASYTAKGTPTPYAYFDSRTYHFIYENANGNMLPGYVAYPAPVPGEPGSLTIALPYKSDIINTSFNPNSSPTDALLLDNAVYFVNRDTFQIVSAGIDGLYGPIVNSGSPPLVYDDNNGNPVPLFTRFPTGLGFHPTEWVGANWNQGANPPLEGYLEGQEDNLGSFSEGRTIEDAQQQ